MIIATRVLKLRRAEGDIDIPIRIFAPQPAEIDWSCTVEIDWPDEKTSMAIKGLDGIDAMMLALRIVGTEIYASDYHESGQLEWYELGKGYGFPVPNNMRDVLIGDDQRYL